MKYKLLLLHNEKFVVILNRGRYSIVRQCIHLSTGDPCVAKLISRKFISHERALHEYALISSVRHDSIVRIVQFIETNSFSIIIGEL